MLRKLLNKIFGYFGYEKKKEFAYNEVRIITTCGGGGGGGGDESAPRNVPPLPENWDISSWMEHTYGCTPSIYGLPDTQFPSTRVFYVNTVKGKEAEKKDE